MSHYAGDDYGPTISTDTLWSIAKRMRPDTSVSVQRMMLALQRTNPEIFLRNNINGLKRGQILRMPDDDSLAALSNQEAIEDVRSQNLMWGEIIDSIAATTPDRPVTAAADDGLDFAGSEVAAMGVDDQDAELRLVAVTDPEMGADRGVGLEFGTEMDTENFALVNEQLEAISQENLELKDRLTEAESIIDDLKRLIELKDDELAAIQQQQISSEQIDELVLAEAETVDVVQEEEFIEDLFAEDAGDELIEEELFDDELAGEEDEQLAEQEVAQETAAEPLQPAAGMLDRIMTLLMNNLMIVAGVLGGLIVLIASFLFMSRRKQSVAKESDTGAAVFPDISASETETVIPAEETQDSISSEAATQSSEEETTASVETEETGQPQAAEQEPVVEEPVEEPQEEEEDPLAEVNVFLAYEHFDQAEEFVRNAIADNPNNLDFHNKLLEVFYAAGNKQSYEEAARVLHDKVDGQGAYWDMALAMWQELSPNRQLFEAAGEAEEAETVAADTGGGLLDLTAEEPDGSSAAEAGLDFDLGAEETGDSAVAGSDAGVLDLTAGQDDVLDVTAAISDIGEGADILDVTAAVGLDTVATELDEGAAENQILDITTGNDDDDLLDVSQSGGEDLLDVSAHTDLGGGDIEEDMLDVTSATSAGADADELLEVSTDEAVAEVSDDNALDFDIGGLDVEPAGSGEAASTEDDNILEFDIGVPAADEADDGLNLSIGDADADNGVSLIDTDDDFDSEDETIQIQLGEIAIEDLEADADSAGLEVDLSINEVPQESGDELSVEGEDLSVEGEDLGVELDLTIDDEAVDSDVSIELPEAELDLDEASTDDSTPEISLELDMADDESTELDMDSTVEMPDISLEIVDDQEDGEDHTVFVPRTTDAPEQSAEDEIATKLDLAKAYVELGDKDSAKTILDEIITDGNEQQRKQAQELLNQVS